MRRIVRIVLWSWVICNAVALAQTAAGVAAISGVVRDISGGVIADARIEVANLAIGIRRSVLTNKDGIFMIPGLPPAIGYNLVVTHTGFAAFQARGIEVLV